MSIAAQEKLRLGCFYPMAEFIQPRTIGNVVVDTFEITPDTWQGFGVERTRPGKYARLRINGEVVMSDTDMELRTNVEAVQKARGAVLIGGLGLGVITLPILRKSTVRSVTVVEKNPHVIAAVEEQIRSQVTGNQSAGFVVHCGDVHKWRPNPDFICKYDFIYLDIWQDLCTDYVKDMRELHLTFRKYLKKGGTVTSWEYDHLRALKQQGRWR